MNTSINKTTGAAITAYTNAANTLHGKLTRVCDALIADGHTDLTLYSAPAKDAERAFYDSLVSFVVKGLPAKEQALLAMPAKELTQEQKARRAQEILDDPVFVEVVNESRNLIMVEWNLTAYDQNEKRESLYYQGRALDEMLRGLRSLIDNWIVHKSKQQKATRKGKIK